MKDTPYIVLMGELCGVFYEDFSENWLHYNGTALYIWQRTDWHQHEQNIMEEDFTKSFDLDIQTLRHKIDPAL